MIEKSQHVLQLKDIYSALLTEKQLEVLNMHFEDDFTLAEIAENTATSKQAAYDIIKRTVSSLNYYEEKLGLAAREQQLRFLLDRALLLINRQNPAEADLDEAKQIIIDALELL